MGFFTHKADPVDALDVSSVDRSRPHPYLPHMDPAHRDHTSCSVCGQEPRDILHIPMAEYRASLPVVTPPQPKPARAAEPIHWS